MVRLEICLCLLLWNTILFAAEIEIQVPVHFTPYADSVVFARTKLVDESKTRQRILYRKGDVLSNKFLIHHTGLYSVEITVKLASGKVFTDIANGYINSLDEIREVNGTFNASCFETLFTVHWLSEKEISETDLYGMSIDTSIIKRYDIPEIDSIADAFCAEGLKWYIDYAVNYGILDSNLVPLINYYDGYYRNPVTTSQMVFAFHNQYLNSPDSIALKGFFANINWLVENNHQGYYLYDFDFSHHTSARMKKYWVSAMAQGYALGALSYAYFITKDSLYLFEADSVFHTLYNNSADYWSVLIDNKGYYWLEEYPNKSFCHVLNGKMAALWGIFQYYSITRKTLALRLLEAGIKTILDNYHMWNIPNQDKTYYCLHMQFKSNYHDLHKRQMQAFANRFHLYDFFAVNDCFSNSQTTIENKNFVFYYMADSCLTYIKSPWKWKIKEHYDWLSVTELDTAVLIKVDTNNTKEKRNACLELELENGDCDSIFITQYAEYLIRANKHLFEIKASGDTLLVPYSTNLPYFDLVCKTNWIRVDTFGQVIQIIAAENSGFEPRSSILKAYFGSSLLIDFVLLQHASVPFLNLPLDSIKLRNDRQIVTLDVSTNITDIQSTSFNNWVSVSWENDSTVSITTKHNILEAVTGAVYFETDYLTKKIFVSCNFPLLGEEDENEKDVSAFKVFPIPARSNLWIVEEENSEIVYSYRLTNVYGIDISNGTFVGTVNLDVSDCSKGLYLLTVENGESVSYTTKIIIH